MGVMFIGVCIALNLLSRARFKKRPPSAFSMACRPPTPLSAAPTATKLRQYHAARLSSVARLSTTPPAPSRASTPVPRAHSGLADDVEMARKSRSQCSSRNSYVIREPLAASSQANV